MRASCNIFLCSGFLYNMWTSRRYSFVVVFYFIFIFALANENIFSWLTAGTPLVIWRQIGWFILLLFTFFSPIGKRKSIRKITYKLPLFLFWAVFMVLLARIQYQFNYVRLVFALYSLVFGYAFLGLGYALSQSTYTYITLAKFLFFTGVFVSVGLIVDAMMGGAITLFFLQYDTLNIEELFSGRVAFLSGSPTVFGCIYSLYMFGLFYLLERTRKQLYQLLLFASSFLFMAGAYVTGSRQILLALVACFGYNLYKYIKKRSLLQYFKTVFPILIVLFLFLGTILSLNSFERLSGRYINDKEMKNIDDYRSNLMMEGVNEFILSGDVVKLLIGNSLSYVSSKSEPNEINGSNYENTFFVIFSNYGIVGIIIIFAPFFYLLKRKDRNLCSQLSFSLVLSHLVVSVLSPNGLNPTSVMTIFLAMGIVMDYSDRKEQFLKFNRKENENIYL